MAESYEVLTGAWSRTKYWTEERATRYASRNGRKPDDPDIVIYLSQQNQHLIPSLLTKSRINELVAGDVLRQTGYPDPEELELQAEATREAVLAEDEKPRSRRKGG